jgi:hypothetical protein
MSLLRRRRRRRLLAALAALLALVGVGYGALAASTSRSQLARAVLWASPMWATTLASPPARSRPGPTRFRFHRPPGGKASAMTATVADLTCGTVVDGLEPPGCDRGERA